MISTKSHSTIIFQLAIVLLLLLPMPCEAAQTKWFTGYFGELSTHKPAYEDYGHIASLAQNLTNEEIIKEAERAYVEEKNVEKAMSWYRILIQRYDSHDTQLDEINPAIYTNLAYLWLFERNNAEQAFPLLMKALEIAQEQENFGVVAAIQSNLAKIFSNYRDFEKAMNLYRQSLVSAVESPTPIDATYAFAELLSFAWLHNRMALISKECDVYSSHNFSGIPLSGYNIELIKARERMMDNHYQSAIQVLDNARSLINSKTDSLRNTALNHLMIAHSAISGNMPQIAVDNLEKATAIIEGSELNDLLDALYKEKISYFKTIGKNQDAMQTQLKSYAIRDSIYNNHRYGIIKDLETSWTVDKLDETIRTQEEENKRIASERDRQLQITLIIGFGLIVIIGLSIWLVIKNQRLNESNRELYKKNLQRAGASPVSEDIETINPQKIEPEMVELFNRLVDILSTNKEIYDPGFSLDHLAQLADSKPRTVSSAINVMAKKNFNAFLGQFRVREACRILSDPDLYGNMTIQAVSEKVGYKSRTYFSKVFKDETGLTTTEFIKQSRQS